MYEVFLFYRLAEQVGIHKLAHGLTFFGSSRLREGTLSIGNGHFFQTSNQFVVRLSRSSFCRLA